METALKIIKICSNGIQNAFWTLESTSSPETRHKQKLVINGMLNELKKLKASTDIDLKMSETNSSRHL